MVFKWLESIFERMVLGPHLDTPAVSLSSWLVNDWLLFTTWKPSVATIFKQVFIVLPLTDGHPGNYWIVLTCHYSTSSLIAFIVNLQRALLGLSGGDLIFCSVSIFQLASLLASTVLDPVYSWCRVARHVLHHIYSLKYQNSERIITLAYI